MTWPADTLAPAEPAQPASRAAGRATPAEDGWRLCQPALAFRALLAVQAAALLAVLWGAEGWPQALAALAPAIFAGMGGTLLWLLLGCGLRRPLARLALRRRVAALTGLGAVALAMTAPLFAVALARPLIDDPDPNYTWPASPNIGLAAPFTDFAIPTTPVDFTHRRYSILQTEIAARNLLWR